MIQYIEGDLFNFVKNCQEKTMLCHIVNTKNAFASGFVKPLAEHYPLVKEQYHQWFEPNPGGFYESLGSNTEPKLGATQFVKVEPNLIVANMMAQTLGGYRPLRYNALVHCMEDVAKYCKGFQFKNIVAPLFGSGLAGGDFNFVEDLIKDIWIENELSVTIYYLTDFLPTNWSPGP